MTDRQIDCKRLLDLISSLQLRHGDDAADRAVHALIGCMEFVLHRGHGNVTMSVKDHKVAPSVRMEYFRNVREQGVNWSP